MLEIVAQKQLYSRLRNTLSMLMALKGNIASQLTNQSRLGSGFRQRVKEVLQHRQYEEHKELFEH